MFFHIFCIKNVKKEQQKEKLKNEAKNVFFGLAPIQYSCRAFVSKLKLELEDHPERRKIFLNVGVGKVILWGPF